MKRGVIYKFEFREVKGNHLGFISYVLQLNELSILILSVQESFSNLHISLIIISHKENRTKNKYAVVWYKVLYFLRFYSSYRLRSLHIRLPRQRLPDIYRR